MKKIILTSLISVFLSLSVSAQVYDAFGNRIPTKQKKTAVKKGENKVDSKGRKQGVWEKYYDNGNPMYKANFKDGKLTGELIRYFKNGQPSVKIIYDDNGEYGNAKLYNKNGKLIA
jgi:antitoxin component YwqK of YwqJK toxin-antitoxin module